MPYIFTETDRSVVFNGEQNFYVQGETYTDAKVEKLPDHYVKQAFEYVSPALLRRIKKLG